MEITKVVKHCIKRGWPNTFGNIVYVTLLHNESHVLRHLSAEKYETLYLIHPVFHLTLDQGLLET